MKVFRLKNSIIYVFLFLFLAVKIVGIHGLFHTEDKDHALKCIICDHAITHNLTPTINSSLEFFYIENPEFPCQNEAINNYAFITSRTIAPGQLVSRPPPFFV